MDYEPDFTPVMDEGEPTTADPETQAAESQAADADGNADANTDGQHDDGADNSARQADGGETNTDADADTSPFMTVKYNHEAKDISKDEATRLVQLGLKHEKTLPMLNQLEYLAAQNGVPVAEMVNGIFKNAENEYRQGLVEKYGDDTETIETLMTAYQNQQKEKFDKVKADLEAAEQKADEEAEQSLNNRIAEQLTEVRELFPNIKEFNDLPQSVRDSAIRGKNIVTEMLKLERKENQKIKENEQAAQNAASASSGSAKSAENSEDAFGDDFVRGIWGG